jgi:hypothetical protein
MGKGGGSRETNIYVRLKDLTIVQVGICFPNSRGTQTIKAKCSSYCAQQWLSGQDLPSVYSVPLRSFFDFPPDSGHGLC